MSNALLDFDPATFPLKGRAMIAFNHAIWSQRTSYFVHRFSLAKHSTAVNRLVEACLDSLPSMTEGKRVSTSPAIEAIVKSPPAHILTMFTDGSALDNPGPSGAGIYIVAPLAEGQVFKLRAHIALGPGSNNTGEAGGQIGDIIMSALAHPPQHIIITDSMLCIGYLTKGWSWSDFRAVDMARAARQGYELSRPKPMLYWVRGHAKVPGNEEADRLAKLGSAHSKNHSDASQDNPFRSMTYDELTPPGVIARLRSAGFLCSLHV
jgi:ribonuclease HI